MAKLGVCQPHRHAHPCATAIAVRRRGHTRRARRDQALVAVDAIAGLDVPIDIFDSCVERCGRLGMKGVVEERPRAQRDKRLALTHLPHMMRGARALTTGWEIRSGVGGEEALNQSGGE